VSSSAQNSPSYSQAIQTVIDSGNQLVDWLSRDQEHKTFALNNLTKAVDNLNTSAFALEGSPADVEQPFLKAAAEIRAGYLLIAAGRAVETGDRTGIEQALAQLKAEKAGIDADGIGALFFEADLLQAPPEAATNEEALDIFKTRAGRTLDNMVTEARDVIAAAWAKFKDKLDSFIGELGELAKSFSATGTGVFRTAVEKVVSGLKSLAEYLKSDSLNDAIGYLKDMVKDFDLEHILAIAFGSAHTKETIQGLALRPPMNRTTLKDAGVRMADVSSRYCKLLKAARWILTAVGVIGGFLVFTPAYVHYATLGIPIAYAVVAVATILIGMTFARSRMGGVIETL
jgi:hypothetical protein